MRAAWARARTRPWSAPSGPPRVKCRPTLELAGRIVDGSDAQEEAIHYFPGDDLFSPGERRRGLPLGNQTSQFLANVYLDPLDQYVNRELRPVQDRGWCGIT